MIYRRSNRPALDESGKQYVDRELVKIERAIKSLDSALLRLKEELIAAGVVNATQITMQNE